MDKNQTKDNLILNILKEDFEKEENKEENKDETSEENIKIIFFKENKNIKTKEEKKNKKREIVKKWNFTQNELLPQNQLNCLNLLLNSSTQIPKDNLLLKTMLSELKRKLYGYKYQDYLKNKLNKDKFISIEIIINELITSNLKCKYCNEFVYILYDISRENKQWTIDRINNDYGHNNDNFCIACLHCNLTRRTKNDEKFLFTKQLKIVKSND